MSCDIDSAFSSYRLMRRQHGKLKPLQTMNSTVNLNCVLLVPWNRRIFEQTHKQTFPNWRRPQRLHGGHFDENNWNDHARRGSFLKTWIDFRVYTFLKTLRCPHDPTPLLVVHQGLEGQPMRMNTGPTIVVWDEQDKKPPTLTVRGTPPILGEMVLLVAPLQANYPVLATEEPEAGIPNPTFMGIVERYGISKPY